MRRGSRRHRQREPAELQITAFMNLMVVLVPFLLITAVFSRLTILELNLPAPSAQAAEDESEIFNMDVVVEPEVIRVMHRADPRPLREFPVGETGYDYRALSEYLAQVKQRYPDKTDATVLLASDTEYDVLVQVMDAVRARSVVEDGRLVETMLFPDISIGDAPT